VRAADRWVTLRKFVRAARGVCRLLGDVTASISWRHEAARTHRSGSTRCVGGRRSRKWRIPSLRADLFKGDMLIFRNKLRSGDARRGPIQQLPNASIVIFAAGMSLTLSTAASAADDGSPISAY
jgi:hypothetical protein